MASNLFFTLVIALLPFVFAQVAATVSTTKTTTGTSSASTAASTVGLNILAKTAGLQYFGTATDNPELTDAPYLAKLRDITDFGQLTPGNSMKWDATEPTRGAFNFTNGDVIVSLAKANGQLVRGHTCVWHSQLPAWVTAGAFNAATLTSIVQTHTSTVVGHYKGQIHSWDVLNEVFADDGTYRTSVFYNTLNTSYITTALVAARAADPAAKLFINDYNIEGTGAKSSAMLALVKSLKAAGTPIDGIGLQAHLIVGSVPTTIQANIQAFVDLGVVVEITELDIRMTLPVSDALLAQQKTDYQTIVTACKNVKGCIGITVWDYTDKYSWIPSVFPTQGAALPWDANLVKKPAYDGIAQGLST